MNYFILPGLLGTFELSTERILIEISESTGISIEKIASKKRNKEIVNARIVYSYLAKKYTDKSLSAIGKKINRDHSTVLHQIREAEKFLEQPNDYLSRLINKFELKMWPYKKSKVDTVKKIG